MASKATTKEHGIEEYFREYFSQRGWLVYKMDQGGGVADRLAVSPKGWHLYVEFKRPGKEVLDPAQVLWADGMRKRIAAGKRGRHIAVLGPINTRMQVRRLYESYKDM